MSTCENDPTPHQSAPVRIITHYGSQREDVHAVLAKHWHILTQSPDISEIMGPRPLLVARIAINLRDNLVQSEFVCMPSRKWLTDLPHLNSMF